jgi:hypothetical protein
MLLTAKYMYHFGWDICPSILMDQNLAFSVLLNPKCISTKINIQVGELSFMTKYDYCNVHVVNDEFGQCLVVLQVLYIQSYGLYCRISTNGCVVLVKNVY